MITVIMLKEALHSSGTQGAQNYLRQLSVLNSLKTQVFLDQDLS